MSSEEGLPAAIRYVKNGAGGKWWPLAKKEGQIHLGWDDYPDDMILSRDLVGLKEFHGSNPTQDFNALVTLLEGDQYIWITIQDGFLWWCTVGRGIGIDPRGSNDQHGHFWLVCDRSWSNKSLQGTLLAISDLPGSVTQIEGYRATVCKPSGSSAVRRSIVGEQDPDVAVASAARSIFVAAMVALVRRLHPKDFEVLIDLILQRTGWARIARLGGAREGIDVEAENPATGELAFVQVKSRANQSVLTDYIQRFEDRRERYSRMVFAVHTTSGTLETALSDVHIWNVERVAELVVTLGLSDWLGRRV